jgi:hypothetical protein
MSLQNISFKLDYSSRRKCDKMLIIGPIAISPHENGTVWFQFRVHQRFSGNVII